MIYNNQNYIIGFVSKMFDFFTILSEYYTNDTLDKAVDYIYNNCIEGIIFENERNNINNNILQKAGSIYLDEEKNIHRDIDDDLIR